MVAYILVQASFSVVSVHFLRLWAVTSGPPSLGVLTARVPGAELLWGHSQSLEVEENSTGPSPLPFKAHFCEKQMRQEGVRDSRPQSTVGRQGATVMVIVSPAWPVMTQYECEDSHHRWSFAPVVPTPACPPPSPGALNNHDNDNDSK